MINLFSALLLLGAQFLIIILILVIAIYIAIGIFLNNFHKVVYGNGTILAFIPIANMYVLGKLTVNKAVGWALVFCEIITGKINGNYILPEGISSFLSTFLSIVSVVLLIYGIAKYNKLK